MQFWYWTTFLISGQIERFKVWQSFGHRKFRIEWRIHFGFSNWPRGKIGRNHPRSHQFAQNLQRNSHFWSGIFQVHSVWKSPKNVAFEFSIFFGIFQSTFVHSVNVARFARNIECDFFGRFSNTVHTSIYYLMIYFCASVKNNRSNLMPSVKKIPSDCGQLL